MEIHLFYQIGKNGGLCEKREKIPERKAQKAHRRLHDRFIEKNELSREKIISFFFAKKDGEVSSFAQKKAQK
ncbi:MAG TPA: hypothetical protein DDY70_01985 [Clostridiales bacterium]|nr:hypothetical protein [Clostridiales bacterium]